MKRTQCVYLILGLLALLATLVVPPPIEGLSILAWRAIGLASMMGIYWMSESLPIPVTSLLPLIFAPFLELGSIKDTASSYGNPLIFLFMGGFLLSIAIEKSGLHSRMAHATLLSVGSNPRKQIAALMGITAFLSMWMSNTATTVLMLPTTLSIIALLKKKSPEQADALAPVMLLGLAYGATIGGMSTIIGTPPNAFLVGFLKDSYGIDIGFAQWMSMGVPFSIVFLVIAWIWLTRNVDSKNVSVSPREELVATLKGMGPFSWAEGCVLAVFLMAAASWILRVPLGDWTGLPISDATIALLAGVSLFMLPWKRGSPERLLEWKQAEKLPWGVLLLFGGGLALAKIIRNSGLDKFIGESLGNFEGMAPVALVAITVALVVALTEVTSNTATTATLLPVLGPVAVALGLSPLSIAVPAAMAASCAFMLPVATPPNAIVFGSGQLRMRDLVRAGLVLNLIAVGLIVAVSSWLLPIVFNTH